MKHFLLGNLRHPSICLIVFEGFRVAPVRLLRFLAVSSEGTAHSLGNLLVSTWAIGSFSAACLFGIWDLEPFLVSSKGKPNGNPKKARKANKCPPPVHIASHVSTVGTCMEGDTVFRNWGSNPQAILSPPNWKFRVSLTVLWGSEAPFGGVGGGSQPSISMRMMLVMQGPHPPHPQHRSLLLPPESTDFLSMPANHTPVAFAPNAQRANLCA